MMTTATETRAENAMALPALPSPAPSRVDPLAIYFDQERMRSVMTIANTMSNALATVPKHLQGRPADCVAIVLQAIRWQLDPFLVAQKTYFVNGIIAYEAQLIAAVLHSRQAVEGRFHFEFKGEGQSLECRAGAVPAGEVEMVWTEWIRRSDITVTNSPLWKTNPKQQMAYLQERNWARLYKPEVIMGAYSPEELVELAPGDVREVSAAPAASGPRRKSEAQQQAEPPAIENSPSQKLDLPASDAVASMPAMPAARPAERIDADGVIVDDMRPKINQSQAAYMRNKFKAANAAVKDIFRAHRVEQEIDIDSMTLDSFDSLKSELLRVL